MVSLTEMHGRLFIKMHLALFFIEEESTIFWWIILVPEFDGSPILFTYSVDGDLIVIFFVVW